jgi:hypothetical protein
MRAKLKCTHACAQVWRRFKSPRSNVTRRSLILLGPASHVTVLGRRADHVIAHEPLIQMDVHQSQSALLDRLELRVKVMPLRAVCLIDTLSRVVVSLRLTRGDVQRTNSLLRTR